MDDMRSISHTGDEDLVLDWDRGNNLNFNVFNENVEDEMQNIMNANTLFPLLSLLEKKLLELGFFCKRKRCAKLQIPTSKPKSNQTPGQLQLLYNK